MKVATAERLSEIRRALESKSRVFVRIGLREYAIAGVSELRHNLAFVIAGDVSQRVMADPDDVHSVRVVRS